ncbi:L-seryl-tRNA(Sec) selenium transferase [Polyangium sorediatum]|uniref:L-seryl-tRNA(Sec) selenium transferase n=1 Tax=Polyangium sorediatum TaxID=889274 RepID=A0ABT6P0B6_9BACT|nr:L-seryl-tRNA(Sec) selenium transferase [Polyangium sorediatum]MDI1434047.1 L-seryl-tRNA(Sec) selenium transferase [Polyangium sorediatum]
MGEEETRGTGGADLRGIPRVDRVLANPSLTQAKQRLGVAVLTRLVRRALDEARDAVRGGAPCPSVEEVALRVSAHAERTLGTRARRVINATGVVLHTNLGRAPLGARVAEALARSAAGYTSIEIDLATGRRGRRGAFAEDALCELSGAEASLVVNNNAAAVLLMLGALAAGRPVVVSRGELVEIGGGFRVPEVMARSGARLVEVGTTNKTRIADYARALDAAPDAAAILRVHQGNFRQVGFVERPEHRALAALARERKVLLLEDLGGGAIVDLESLGLSGEPSVRSSVEAGSDVVCFSTDKVLGGPQGGAIVGRADLVAACRKDPLARALRLGRLPLVALEATLAAYLEGDLDVIPTMAALRAPLSAVRARAERIQGELAREGVTSSVVELGGAVGGGACAEEPLPSFGVALDAAGGEIATIAERLRAGDPPVLPRVQEGRILFDVRTLLDGEDAPLTAAIVSAVKG